MSSMTSMTTTRTKSTKTTNDVLTQVELRLRAWLEGAEELTRLTKHGVSAAMVFAKAQVLSTRCRPRVLLLSLSLTRIMCAEVVR